LFFTTRGTGVIALQEEQTLHPYAPPLLPLAEIAQPTLSSWTFFLFLLVQVWQVWLYRLGSS